MKKFSLSLCVLGSVLGLTGTDVYATCDSTLTMLRNEGQALIKMLTTYNEGSDCYSNCDKKYPWDGKEETEAAFSKCQDACNAESATRSKLATRIADKKDTYKSNWLYAKRHNCSLSADLKADHKKVRELSEQQNSAGF